MSFRVHERLGPADVLSLSNAALGVVAMLAAFTVDPGLVARLILLAAVADGLDGIVARRYGSSEVGPLLDSIADTVSFGTTPAVFVFVVVREAWGPLAASPGRFALALAVPALFVVLSIVRTGFYTVHVAEGERRPGVQNTLAASILAAAYLAGVTAVPIVLAAATILALLMIAPIGYPKLGARDALVMGAIQAGAIAVPTALDRLLPRVLLLAALAYLLLAPRFYWDSQRE